MKSAGHIVCFLLLMIQVEIGYAQELRDLAIQLVEEVPELPTIMAEYPDYAYLVFFSSITNLEFETNWVKYADLSEPEEGRYVFVVDTVRHAFRVSVPNQFKARDIQIPKLAAKQTVYYDVQPANARQLDLALREFEQEAYESAITRLRRYLLISNLTTSQRGRAHHLIALCHYELGDTQEMNRALYSLMEVYPEDLPTLVANPPSINDFMEAYRDSVYLAPPSRPRRLRGAYNNRVVALRWNRNREHDILKYNIYRYQSEAADTLLIDQVDGEITTYIDDTVDPFETYAYHVTASDERDPQSEGASSATFTIETIPPLVDRMRGWPDEKGLVSDIAVRAVSDSVFAIIYTLKSDLRRTYDVSVAISSDAGQSFNLIPKTLSGDIGASVQDGSRKQMFWNYKADLSTELIDDSYLVKIDALPRPLWEQIQTVEHPLVTQFSVQPSPDSLLTISYTLLPDRKNKYQVSFTYAQERNSAYGIRPQSLISDLDRAQKGGRPYQVQWRVLEDFPQGIVGDVVLKLEPTPVPDNSRRNLYLATGGAAALVGGALLLLRDKGSDVVASAPPDRPGN